MTLYDRAGLYSTIQNDTGPCRIYKTKQDSIGHYRAIKDYTGLYRTIQDHAGLYRTIEDYTGLYRTMKVFLDYISAKNL